MNMSQLFIECMNKIQECVIWYGEVDSKTLMLFVINFFLIQFFFSLLFYMIKSQNSELH